MNRVGALTGLVPMSFNVPVSEDVTRIIFLGAGHFNLLETPLRQVDVGSPEIATKRSMAEAE